VFTKVVHFRFTIIRKATKLSTEVETYHSAIWMFVLFMSIGRDCVSELRPPTGLLLISQVIYEYGEPQWNNTYRGWPKNSEENLSQYHFVYHQASALRGWQLTI
jgi:hypothetical protein